MNKIFSVFKRDIKAILKNPIAMLIIGGVCFIPSLYAWVNIKAAWDPYTNTGSIPIAVVNNDKGSEFNGKEMNIGNDVIDELKNNDQIGWKFVDSKQADIGVVNGEYYAVIEIPEDFSKDLTSLTTDNPVKPEITYKVDTKSNPVSGKITGGAEGKLVNEIKSNFVQTVNETVFSSLNKVGKNLEDNKKAIINLKEQIIKLNKNMDSIISILNGVGENSKNLNTYLSGIKDTLPGVTQGISSVQDGTKRAEELTNYTKNTFNNSFNNIDMNLNQISSANKRIDGLVKEINQSISNGTTTGINSSINLVKQDIDFMNNSIDNIIKYLQSINVNSNNAKISEIISSLNNVSGLLNKEKESLKGLEDSLQNRNNANIEALNNLNGANKNLDDSIINLLKQYNSDAKPALNSIFNNFIIATKDANKILDESKKSVNQINDVINLSLEGTKLTEETTADLKNTLNQFKGEIKTLSEKLSEVKDNDLTEIISILQSNPEIMGEYIANPFETKDESIYKIPNYGTGMTPIYSVLAIWVGGLILTSLLKTDVTPFEGSEELTVRQKYLGKMITFLFLGVIQGAIIALGDKFILGVYTVNTPLLVAFAMACSLSFVTIIYTLVSLFGNVGKAFAIILMVIQIAGSGGSYPIQVDPLFFRIVQPFFPFTYGLGGFREAIAGPLLSSVVEDFVMLFILSGVFLVIGIFFKEKLDKNVRKFEEKFEESGIAE